MISIQIDADSMIMDYTNRFGITSNIFAGTDADGEAILKEATEQLHCCGAGTLQEALFLAVQRIA